MSEKLKVKDFHCQNCAHKWHEALKEKMPCCPRCGSDHTQLYDPFEREGGPSETEAP